MVAAHAVDSASRRCRRGADEKPRNRHCIWVESKGGASQDLHEVLNTAGDVAADVVGIVFLEVGSGHGMPRQNTIPKSGRESFDLRFDTIGHIDFRIGGNVTVRPSRVLTLRSATVVEQTRLRQQYERSIRTPSFRHGGFGCCNLLCSSAKVNCGGLQTFLRLPGDWRTQSPIQFEYSRAVPEFPQFPSITWRQPVESQLQNLARGEIEDH